MLFRSGVVHGAADGKGEDDDGLRGDAPLEQRFPAPLGQIKVSLVLLRPGAAHPVVGEQDLRDESLLEPAQRRRDPQLPTSRHDHQGIGPGRRGLHDDVSSYMPKKVIR